MNALELLNQGRDVLFQAFAEGEAFTLQQFPGKTFKGLISELDREVVKNRPGGQIYDCRGSVCAKCEQFPEKPIPGKKATINGTDYLVKAVQENYRTYNLTLVSLNS